MLQSSEVASKNTLVVSYKDPQGQTASDTLRIPSMSEASYAGAKASPQASAPATTEPETTDQ